MLNNLNGRRFADLPAAQEPDKNPHDACNHHETQTLVAITKFITRHCPWNTDEQEAMLGDLNALVALAKVEERMRILQET